MTLVVTSRDKVARFLHRCLAMRNLGDKGIRDKKVMANMIDSGFGLFPFISLFRGGFAGIATGEQINIRF